MTMRGVDHNEVSPCIKQQFDAFLSSVPNTNCRADAQAALLVFARVRVFGGLKDVFDRDQAAQLERIVHDEHAL